MASSSDSSSALGKRKHSSANDDARIASLKQKLSDTDANIASLKQKLSDGQKTLTGLKPVAEALNQQPQAQQALQQALQAPQQPQAHNATPRIHRFAVTEVMQGGNYHDLPPAFARDLHVSLRPTHGLYTLLEVVFEACVKEDAIYSHIWNASLAGRRYAGPFEGCGSNRETECTSESPVPLGPLALCVGARGAFRNESASFRFELVGLEVPEEGKTYPLVVECVETALTANKAADHLTAQERDEADTFRERYAAYMAGENAWLREIGYDGLTYVRGKPKPERWDDHGGNSLHPLFKIHDIMGLLMRAGWGFSVAWRNVLVYCVLRKSKGASATRFSFLKKNSYMIHGIGRGLSAEDKVKQAKRLAKGVMASYLRAGIPEIGPKPAGGMRGLMAEFMGDDCDDFDGF